MSQIRNRCQIVDEPTVGVDPQSRNFIFENVEALNRDGLTVLYTTHYMEEAQHLCNRVAIIDQGQIIALNTPKALIESLGGGIIHLGVPPEMPELLVAEVEHLPDVQHVTHTDGKLEITAQHAQRTLVSVIKVFNDADISITSLEILEPNLETVFLHLTGKRLRN